jgi:hypothetical protein
MNLRQFAGYFCQFFRRLWKQFAHVIEKDRLWKIFFSKALPKLRQFVISRLLVLICFGIVVFFEIRIRTPVYKWGLCSVFGKVDSYN